MASTFLVASRIDATKVIDPDQGESGRINFFPISHYEPGGIREVPEPVFHEMLKYRYKWPQAGFALVSKEKMSYVGSSLLVDVLGTISYLEKQPLDEATPELKEIVVGGETVEAQPEPEDPAVKEIMECPECGRKGFDKRTLELHIAKSHKK